MWMRAMSDVDDDEGKLRIGLNQHRVISCRGKVEAMRTCE